MLFRIEGGWSTPDYMLIEVSGAIEGGWSIGVELSFTKVVENSRVSACLYLCVYMCTCVRVCTCSL